MQPKEEASLFLRHGIIQTNKEAQECPICRQIQPLVTIKTCHHEYCECCIRKWYSQTNGATCPECRSNLRDFDLYCHMEGCHTRIATPVALEAHLQEAHHKCEKCAQFHDTVHLLKKHQANCLLPFQCLACDTKVKTFEGLKKHCELVSCQERPVDAQPGADLVKSFTHMQPADHAQFAT